MLGGGLGAGEFELDHLEQRVLLSTVVDDLPELAELEDTANPVVVLETSAGDIHIELFAADAPRTVENFLAYVRGGHYRGSFFHEHDEGVKLGLGAFVPDFERGVEAVFSEELGPIENEFGRSNLERTVAMDKVPGQPDSATSRFFFNLADNSARFDDTPADDSIDSGGFTVFGRVVDDGSWEVVQRVTELDVHDFFLDPQFFGQGFDRFDRPLFVDERGVLTLEDTSSPANFRSDLRMVPGGGEPFFDPGRVLSLGNAQIVKPQGVPDFYDQVVAQPEGYASRTVTESVELFNPNDVPARVQVLVRYEFGELRDEVIFEGELDAGERRTLVVNDESRGVALVRRATPYAYEVYSAVAGDASERTPVLATLNHSDFGGSFSQSFVDVSDPEDRSDRWHFSMVPSRDMDDPPAGEVGNVSFLLLQNLTDRFVRVFVWFMGDAGDVCEQTVVDPGPLGCRSSSSEAVNASFLLGPRTRSGVHLTGSIRFDRDRMDFPPRIRADRISIEVGASGPIVASVSAYEGRVTSQRRPRHAEGADSALSQLGVPALSNEGVAPSVMIPSAGEARLRASAPVQPPSGPFGREPVVASLQARLPDGRVISRVPDVYLSGAQTHAELDLGQLFPEVPRDIPFALSYTLTPGRTATLAVDTIAADGTSREVVPFQARASSRVAFAGGTDVGPDAEPSGETISIFNPFGDEALGVTLTFHFSDGSAISTGLLEVAPLRSLHVATRDLDEVFAKISSDPAFASYAITIQGTTQDGSEARRLVANYQRHSGRGSGDLLAMLPTVLGAPLPLDDPRFGML